MAMLHRLRQAGAEAPAPKSPSSTKTFSPEKAVFKITGRVLDKETLNSLAKEMKTFDVNNATQYTWFALITLMPILYRWTGLADLHERLPGI